MTTHRCSRALTAVMLVAGAFLFLSRSTRADDAPPAAPAPDKIPVSQAEKVNAAIKRGVEFLYSIQKQDGSWENVPAPAGKEPANPQGGQWGGFTSMATYALLAAGENPQDPRLAKAIDWLLNPTNADRMIGNYACGLRAQVWLFLPDNHPQRAQIKDAIKRDFNQFTGTIHKDVKDKDSRKYGFFPYTKGLNDHFDRSVSQYGVLGLWAVAQTGYEVSRDYWELIDKSWKKAQQPEGGWNYNEPNGLSTPNMTAAGLATLFITEDYLTDPKAPCTGNKFNQNIELALAWMDKNAPAMLKGEGYYGMYGVERIGVASGRKYFGKTAWYDVGSENIVKKQLKDGSWHGPEHDFNGIPNTCFAMYFLTRGRAPVIMNKLEWKSLAKEGAESGWNQRHRDVANFSKWMGKNLDGRFINWQIVNLKGNVDDLHDSPILYIAGSEGLAFPPEDVAKLKRFVEDGGIILGNADCARPMFTKSFKALGKQLWPGEDFRPLPLNHPIFASDSVQFKASKWKTKPTVLGLSNGVRELMILVPDADPAKAWQSHSDRTKEELYQLGANISLYSNGGQNLRYRGITHIVKDNGKPAPANTLRVARLQYKGNFDPEPGGWRRLAMAMKNANLAQLVDFDKPVTLGQGQLAGYKFASLTGTAKFTLAAGEREELKKFVEGGGTLLVDAAGGSPDFADSAEVELALIFGDAAKKSLATPLSADHPLYAAPKIESFEYRNFARRIIRGRQPRVRAMAVNNRLGVYFSREDLSAGLVGQDVDGVMGYAPETATEIVRNILMYDGTVAEAPVAGAAAPPAIATPPAAAPVAPAKPIGGSAKPNAPAVSAKNK
jgi:hypothetical protein